ncbi:MAG: peptidoglycan-binding protein [Patescibacteria group bacterium]|nr:peptidoglycan-binding protein [Patescibacteria group bacterium]MDE2438538.1 peptidoglycan-binding protein [Patescibacteria group bacterium]
MGNNKFKKTAAKVIAIGLSLTTAMWLSGAALALPTVAKAATVEELQAQIASLLQQITALQAQLSASTGASTASAACSFSRSLTVGSRGNDVTCLQGVLHSDGYLAVPATGYFGSLTKAAVAKWQAAKGVSPAAGYFGPISQKAFASMTATTTTTTGTTTTTTTGTTTTTTTGTTTPAPTGNGLTVSVDASNPAAGNFPAGGSKIPFMVLKVVGGSSDTTVTAMNVYRSGLSSDNDVSNVYLMDGSTVLATNIGLSNGKVQFSLSSGLFTVKAGQTRLITVAADIATTGASKTFAFGVNSASDITASTSVSGSFPMTGNQMTAVTVSNPSLATLTLNNLSTGGSVNAGTTNFLAGQFSFVSANSAVSVKSIKLTENDTINASTDLANIKLMNGTTQVGATLANLNADGTAVFDLSKNPLQIASGQTVNLSVYADVVGGVNRHMTFTIQRSYDVVATDMTYNVGASVLAQVSFPISATQVTVNAGTLVVNKDAASPNNYVAAGATNATLATFDFQANGEPVRITALTYQIGSYTSGAETTVWNNLKLVDDQGVQIGTTVTAGATVGTSKANALTNLNYIIPANTTRKLSVIADIAAAYAGSVTGSITSITGQGYTSLAAITDTTTHSGNALSASSAPFVAAKNNAVGSISTVAGAMGVRVGSFTLTAGPAEGINVTSLTLTPSSTAGHLQNMKVMVGGTQVGSTQATVTTSAFTVSPSAPIAIATGGQIVVDVYADTVSGATSSASTVVSLTTAQGTGASTNTTRTATGTSVAGQSVTVNSAGTLTSALATPSIQTQQVGMGVSGVVLGSFKLSETSNSESVDVTSLGVDVHASSANDIKNLRLMSGTTQVGSAVSGISAASSTTTFTLSTPLNVPQNSYINLNVVADMNDQTGGATSADTVYVGIPSITAQGHMSGSDASVALAVNTGATFTIYQTSMVPAIGPSFTSPAGLSDGSIVGQFNITAGANHDVVVKSVSLSMAGSLLQSSSSVALTVYGSDAPSTTLGTSTATSTNTYVVTLNGSTGWTVAKGSTQYLIVKANLGSATNLLTTTGTRSYQINLQAASWNDGVSNASINPIVVTPINGQVSNFSF